MLKRIMIATDGSKISMQAAKLAVGLAKISEATLTIVYVMDIHRLAQLPGYAAMPGLKDNLIESCSKKAMRLHQKSETWLKMQE